MESPTVPGLQVCKASAQPSDGFQWSSLPSSSCSPFFEGHFIGFKNTILLSAGGNASTVWKFFCFSFFKHLRLEHYCEMQLHTAALLVQPVIACLLVVFLLGKALHSLGSFSTGGCQICLSIIRLASLTPPILSTAVQLYSDRVWLSDSWTSASLHLHFQCYAITNTAAVNIHLSPC